MTTRKTIIGRIANSLLTFMSRRRLPQIEGNLTLQGVHSPVEILRDHWGIPHIYAQNQRDLFYAQGFVHAQDRLFQMELNRRTAAGRLSELFGELSLDTDRTIRTFGFNRLGKADLSNACDEIHTVMQAYAAGVNAFLEHPDTKLPVEFTLLNQSKKSDRNTQPNWRSTTLRPTRLPFLTASSLTPWTRKGCCIKLRIPSCLAARAAMAGWSIRLAVRPATQFCAMICTSI